MFSSVCFVYPWATQGGVERVFLNRLMAFQKMAPDLRVDILFLFDSGGAEPLRAALREHGIDARILVAPDFEPSAAYNYVFCVDCPQAFALCERRGFRYAVECHTSYVENRQYLQSLSPACERIVVPSALFGQRLMGELTPSTAEKIRVLRNFIPWDVTQALKDLRRPAWSRRPLLFFGRMDQHKNPLMLLDALAALELRGDRRFFALMCGTASQEVDLAAEVSLRKLDSLVMVLPSVPFASTHDLLHLVQQCGGVYVSPWRCCINHPEAELPQTSDGFTQQRPSGACPER